MSILSRLKRRRALDDDDFDAEVRAHLAMAEAERIADGADPDDARYAALREFGNVTLTTEAARRVWTPRWLEAARDLATDVRYAVRSLRKNPGFALAVVAVLTLGIGLNAAVFTMLKSIAVSPLAGVAGGGARLAVVHRVTASGRALGLSYPDYQYVRRHARAFSDVMGSSVATVGLGRGKGSRSMWGELVTGNYFQVLGVRAALGRTLLPSDESAPGRQPVVVLNDGLWRRDFGADPDIVGKSIEINHTPLTVVGVADPDFHGTTVVYDVEVFIPITMAPQLGFRFGSPETSAAGVLSDRRAALFYLQGYLRPGTTVASADAQARAFWSATEGERPPERATERLTVVPFWQVPGSAQINLMPTLTVLSGMGLLVLAIACANIAGLVLVRGVSRRGEIAMRLALGASRRRILRLLVVENLVLAIPGAVLGVVVASLAVPVLVEQAEALAAPERLFFNVSVDAYVVGFSVLVACGCAIVFGFIPALSSSRVDLVSVINEDASPRGAGRGRLRTGLVVVQVAVSLLLLVGAGLVSRSREEAGRIPPGFDGRQVSEVSVDLRQNGYDEARGRLFYRRLLEAARADAGVESATLAAWTPLAFLDTPSRRVSLEGHDAKRGDDLAFLSNAVGPGYFQALRIPLAAGRGFDAHDDAHGQPVAVVNRTLATRYFGGPSAAIGRRIRVGDEAWRTVVGVASDVKYIRIDEAPRPYVYVPFEQAYQPRMILHTSGQAPVDRLVGQARARIEALDANLPILSARPLADGMKGAFIFFDLAASMLFVFGVAGMALAAMGTYGLVSYVVKQSTHEIGIRLALGATAASIVRRFLARGLVLGGLGAIGGLAAAIGASRLLGHILVGVSATDPASFARAIALVLGTVAAATVVPAWRASKVSALEALRHQ
jgi:predicted permease